MLVGLHERRRAPWAGVKHQIISDHVCRPLNHRDALDLVRRDGKRGQRRVAFVDVGVAPQPKVARVDAGPDDVVPNAFRTKIGVQQGLLLGFTNKENTSAEASVIAPPIPKKVWNFLAGFTKMATSVSKVWSADSNSSTPSSDKRLSVFSAVTNNLAMVNSFSGFCAAFGCGWWVSQDVQDANMARARRDRFMRGE